MPLHGSLVANILKADANLAGLTDPASSEAEKARAAARDAQGEFMGRGRREMAFVRLEEILEQEMFAFGHETDQGKFST